MTWKSHRIVTLSFVYLVTGNLLWAFLSAIGSCIPDQIELAVYKNKAFAKDHHRKTSHWFLPYILLALLALTLSCYSGLLLWSASLQINDIVSWFTKWDFPFSKFPLWAWISLTIAWLAIGAICHILEDAISGKVPGLNPNKRTIGIRLFKTGSIKEYIFTFLFAIAFLLKILQDLKILAINFPN